MENRKSQSTILVVATLGVYLGLVLAGATPHSLGQAALTRQFDVKDEIELKEDLDSDSTPATEAPASSHDDADHAVARSVIRFLSLFTPAAELVDLPSTPAVTLAGLYRQLPAGDASSPAVVNLPLNRMVVIGNYPRAGIDAAAAV